MCNYLHCVQQLHKGQIRAALSGFQSGIPTQGTYCEVTNEGGESNLVPFCCAMGSAGTSEALAGAVRICFLSHSLESSVPSACSHKHEILPKFILTCSYLGHTNQLKKKILQGLYFFLGEHFDDNHLAAIAAASAPHLPMGPVMRRAGGIAH